MSKFYILAAFLLCLFSNSVFAQQAHPTFAIQPVAQAWLNYYNFMVPFDSSMTVYHFGETKLINGTDTSWINLATTVPNDSTYYADSTRGAHPELASLSNTESFVIPLNGHISFYRQLLNSNFAQYWSSDTSKGKQLGWNITDTTQFAIHLIRDSDNAVLATLDSVGTFAKRSYLSGDTRYGTQYQYVSITCALPNLYAGTSAHIGIMPSWYGSINCTCCTGGAFEPYAMCFKRSSYYLNVTAMCDNYGNPVITTSTMSSWAAQKYSQLISYCDSITSLTGCTPTPPLAFDSAAQLLRYYQRYSFMPIRLSNGDTTYEDTDCKKGNIGFSKMIAYRSGNSSITIPNSKLNNYLKIISVAFGADPNIISLNVQSSSSMSNVSVAITTIDGKSIGAAWNGNIINGINSLSIPLPHVASDAYMIYILTSGVIRGSTKIIVVR